MIQNNPQISSDVRGHLADLAGGASGYLPSLSAEVKRRLLALKNLDDARTAVEAKFQRELAELEHKYQQLYQVRRLRRAEAALRTRRSARCLRARSPFTTSARPSWPASATRRTRSARARPPIRWRCVVHACFVGRRPRSPAGAMMRRTSCASRYGSRRSARMARRRHLVRRRVHGGVRRADSSAQPPRPRGFLSSG